MDFSLLRVADLRVAGLWVAGLRVAGLWVAGLQVAGLWVVSLRVAGVLEARLALQDHKVRATDVVYPHLGRQESG